jgi:alkylated DNA nucleotide flippase Atl1
MEYVPRRIIRPTYPAFAARTVSDAMPDHDRILARVRAIPEGWVRTYGDLSPGAPRLTGTVLRGSDDPALPWHRVVRADGTLAKGERQRALLAAEGVPFDARGRVELRVARLPADHGGSSVT